MSDRESLVESGMDTQALNEGRKITVQMCELTSHPCGTDTWNIGNPPDCRCGRIKRLQQELAQVKRQNDLYRLSPDERLERAESAERQVTELSAQMVVMVNEFHAYCQHTKDCAVYKREICDCGLEYDIENILPNQVNKLLAMVEAAKHHYRDSLEGEKNASKTSGNFSLKRHIQECEVCQAVRALESK